MKNNKWKPQASFGGQVIRLSYNLTQAAKKALKQSGLEHVSFARFWVLHELSLEPLNQASLCERLGQKPPSMMEMLDRLAQDNLVKSKALRSDPRRKQWSLTAQGFRDYQKAREVIRDVGRKMDQFFYEQGIPEKEISRVKEILTLLNREHFQEESR